MDDIALRLEQLEERIEAACRRCGRKRQDVKLMAVTKFHPVEAVEAAWNAGLRLFGESRVHEGVEKFIQYKVKYPASSPEIHLIGSLQRNKAKAAASFYDCIQSVDREALIDELGALTRSRENPLMILLEYHTGEDTKAGFLSRDDLFRAAEKLMSYPGLNPSGLMTMAPFTGDTALIRSAFRELAVAACELERRFPSGLTPRWSCLSMGMTGDFETAIEEGSTMIRVGTAIFGER